MISKNHSLGKSWWSQQDYTPYISHTAENTSKYLERIENFPQFSQVTLRHLTSTKINKLRGAVNPPTGEKPGKNLRRSLAVTRVPAPSASGRRRIHSWLTISPALIPTFTHLQIKGSWSSGMTAVSKTASCGSTPQEPATSNIKMLPSSNWLGHRIFIPKKRVQISPGVPSARGAA